MNDWSPTPAQQQAITFTAGSLTVAAAAGSGKTAVLARRCAYLVSEARPAERCNIDELLVVTFTEAAAAEMRHRIRRTLQQLRDTSAHPTLLEQQLLLVDQASISTIHAFCLRLLRQHFMQLDLDPFAVVLNEEESSLLLQESMERVLETRQQAGDGRTWALRELLRHYFGDDEAELQKHLQRLYPLVYSMPEPQHWLDSAVGQLTMPVEQIIRSEQQLLRLELQRLAELNCWAIGRIRQHDPIGHNYADQLVKFVEPLALWSQQLADPDQWPALLNQLLDFDLGRVKSGPRNDELNSAQLTAKEHAGQCRDLVKKYFTERIVGRFSRFTPEEWRTGLQRLQPYVLTLVQLVRELDADYQSAKRQRHALDFADLERFAYQLLVDADSRPSAIARQLQEKYAYVLIDEFQDVNPLQQAILLRLSRDHHPHLRSNLFCVGDIKQSIYRFRLADAELFLQRLADARPHSDQHRRIHLTDNFRSAAAIVRGVNLLFSVLMQPTLGGIRYDEEAALRHHRQDEPPYHPVEIFIVPVTRVVTDEEDESGDENELEEWDELVNIERQGHCIAERIQQLVAEGEYQYRDIVVLLRSTPIRAEQLAGMLQARGIPTSSSASSGLFAVTEIRELLALLAVLDNPQQDIPLATVMRSGISGAHFTEGELLQLRRRNTRLSFYQAVFAETSAQSTQNPLPVELQQKVMLLQQTLARYRLCFARQPLPAALGELYEATQLLTKVCGRNNGQQRQANLLAFQDRAEKFSTTAGDGSLNSFLQYLEILQQREEDWATGQMSDPQQQLVRVTTIHQSKGLEFPVVFVVNLEKRFNLADSRSRLIFDRHRHIGLPVVDIDKRCRYPSLIQRQIAEAINRETLAEELRILYVALTRARDRLILVASADMDAWREQLQQSVDAAPATLPEALLHRSQSYWDWLTLALQQIPESERKWHDDPDSPPPLNTTFVCRPYPVPDPRWLRSTVDTTALNRRQAAAALQPLPDQKPTTDPAADAVIERITRIYPHLALSSIPTVLTVSELKRRVNLWSEYEHPHWQLRKLAPFISQPKFTLASGHQSAEKIGSLTHLFLQHLDYRRVHEIPQQLRELQNRGLLTTNEAELISLENIEWFLATPLGRRCITAADQLLREVVFTGRESVTAYDPQVIGPDAEDFLLVRGMIDLLLPTGRNWEVIDFKTDALPVSALAKRTRVYQEQLQRYAMHMAAIWRVPVTTGHLVYLQARQIVSLATTPPASPVNST
ncbi:MAG: ATP-dependent helicase/nuclease subunit A [Phycisphaerae bacterium]|nr:ATP-dependent helicase/nuclease subunit A [Phycisphaerae bacterium]